MITKTIVNLKKFSNQVENFNHDDSRSRGFHIIARYVSYLMVMLFVLFSSSMMNEAKAAELSIKIDGTETTYTGKQVSATMDGKTVNMKGTPGIVMNGTSYVSYKDVFGSSKLGVKATYNSKKKTITLKKYDKKLVMTLGSTTAYLNGTEVTLPAAPMKVTYVEKKSTKIMVPTEFVSKSLGFDYSWSATATTVTAAIQKGLVIKYDGKTYAYSNIKGSVTADGEAINVSTLPVIQINDTYMVQAKAVFASKIVGGSYKYTKSKKNVTLTLDDITIKMKLGSKEATVDGKKVSMDAPATMVKNVNTGKSYVCVPANFVCQTFGYNYHWNSTSSTYEMEWINDAPADSDEENNSQENTTDKDSTTVLPENGSQGNNNGTNNGTTNGNTNGSTNGTNSNNQTNNNPLPPVVFANYQLTNQYYDQYNYLSKNTMTNFNNTVSTGSMSNIASVTKLMTANVPDREMYVISAIAPFTNITSTKNESNITISATNMMTSDANYPFTSEFISTISTKYVAAIQSSDIIIALNDKSLSYELSLSADMLTLTVTIYTNYIGGAEIGRNQDGEYLKLTSLMPITPTISESDEAVSFMIPNTINGVGDFTFTNNELLTMKGITCVTANTNDLLITINRTAKAAYKVVQGTDNTYTIVFASNVTPSNPTNGTDNGTNQGGTTQNGTSGNSSTGATLGGLDYESIKIPMPSGFTASNITNEDLYLKKMIKLYLPGDYTSSISSSTIMNNSSYVSNVAVTFENGETVITLTTNRICGFDYKVQDGFLCVAVDKPGKVYDKIVVIDPGHGGGAIGAPSPNRDEWEKNLNLKIAYTLGSEYLNDTGVKCYYTRIADNDVDNKKRAEFVKQVDGDLFISVHMNSSTSSSPSGSEVYYLQTSKFSMGGLTAYQMAKTLSANISAAMDTNNRGPKASQNLTVLKYNTVPAVLVEVGFMANPSEYAKLADETYQRKTAQSLAATIVEFFDDYSTGR